MRAAGGLLVLAALIVPIIIWREQLLTIFAQRERVVAAVRSASGWGPIVIIGLTVAQIVAAPIPGQAINFVAGYLYGFWLGAFWSWVGTVLGSALVMALARWVGRPLVTRLVSPDLLVKLDRLAASRGLWFFFLVFLIPGLPDDAVCFLAGLTPLPLPALIVAAAIGRMPGIMGAAWAGAYAGRLPWQGWVVLGGLALLGAVIAWRWGDRIQDAILRRL
jgi:uncharacterized membrane protein YdjX (TVP38/TMEM64 family)